MIRKLAGGYSALVGLSMLAMWFVFYLSGSIPELETEPWRIGFHLAAECITAVGLIIAAWGLAARKHWAVPIYTLATGALLYTLIQSPGYFLQLGDANFAIMFAVLIVAGTALLVGMLKE